VTVNIPFEEKHILTRENMNESKRPKALVQKTIVAVIFIMQLGSRTSNLYSAEPSTDALSQTNSAPWQTNSAALPVSPPEVKKTKIKTRLTGAELYSINCNRCHQERYPTERTGAQWKTIMLHMQIRANIPVSQARLILKYLQENSGR
jgi:hypothetical protein